jgi:hypothetical protein
MSTENKRNELQVKEVLEDILRLVVEENKPAKTKSGDVEFIKEIIDITITTNKKPVKQSTKYGHRVPL